MNQSPPALFGQNLTKSFGSTMACDNVTLNLPQGSITALLGPNGAGKTTLIDLLVGLQKPDLGSSQILGMDPHEAIDRSVVGVINQTGSLPLDYKVKDALELFAGFYLRPVATPELLRQTNLESLAGRPIRKLSGGEQQRVRLALALQPDPLVLILDEPTAGLDTTAREHFWELMGQEAGAGRTILFATHYLAEAEAFAPRTTVMRGGKVIADAPTDDLRKGKKTLVAQVAPKQRESLLAALDRPDWDVTLSNGTLTLVAQDTDAAAQVILSHPGTFDLLISRPSLDETFKDLMKEPA